MEREKDEEKALDGNIPVVDLPTGTPLSSLKQGLKARVEADARRILVSLS